MKETPKVELTLPDGSIFKGKKRETDQKISEIIGLDADQFTQISMIAQGEFLKLLLAESRERKKIFSRIFQTRFYYRIQEELKKQAVQLYVKLEQNLQEMKLEMARVEYPSYKKDGGVRPEEVQLENCTEEKETYKAVEGDCRAGYSGQRTYIRDFERNHRSGKPVGKSMQKRIFPGADST